MKKPIASLVALVIAFSAFAQAPASSTIKVKSKGDDIRTVIDSIFEQSGKQYVLETNVHQSLYMSLDGVTFDKAIDIISNVASLEFEEKQGIWYVRTKTSVKTSAKPSTVATKTSKSAKTLKPLPTAKPSTATQKFVTDEEDKTATPTPVTVNLTGRLTVQLKKMDIREVFGEFGRQTKVDIEIDENVPNYKLDAYFYNTSLKFALDKICKIAKLKYTFTPSKTVRISKA